MAGDWTSLWFPATPDPSNAASIQHRDETNTMNDRIIPITDDRGRLLVPADEAEPLPGSVVLTNGLHGTAWQHQFSDGLWVRLGGGRAFTWERLLRERNLVLVYDAEPRNDNQSNTQREQTNA